MLELFLGRLTLLVDHAACFQCHCNLEVANRYKWSRCADLVALFDTAEDIAFSAMVHLSVGWDGLVSVSIMPTTGPYRLA